MTKPAATTPLAGFPPATPGPLTRRRLRRTSAVYAAVLAVGAVLVWLGNPAWKVFGVGLWYPGAGFLALGGWYWVLTAVTLLLFGASLVAWFGAGANTFPPLLWLTSAGIAALLSNGHVSNYGIAVAIALGGLVIAVLLVYRAIARARLSRTRSERIAYLPGELAAIRDRAARVPAVDDRELDADALAGLRYILDRALQDAGDFSNFDKIDQFQTSALRYQINWLGYALAQVSFHYTPAFSGYSHEAQNRLVEKYLERSVWGYWRWENAWGRLSLDADPAKDDNIMLTGYLAVQVYNIAAATGDDRWNREGALTFRLNDRKVYRHDGHSLIEQLMRNYRTQHFTLWPCEPNWIYPACNLRGAMAVRSYDRLFGTSYWDEIRDKFRLRLDTEFANLDGSMVSLRSKHTGFAVPFPMPNATVPQLTNALFPDVAQRHWAISRHEDFCYDEHGLRVKESPMSIDYGNYRPSVVSDIAALFNGATEMGDEEAAAAARDELNCRLTAVRRDGTLYYEGVSTLWNTWVAQDRTGFRNCWRSLVIDPPPECVTRGPQLARANYPDVLVASARNDGQTLRLVLRPGGSVPEQDLTLARLDPERRYQVMTDGQDQTITADVNGRAVVRVGLHDRLELIITPSR